MSQQPVPGTRSAVRNVERAAPGSPIWPCTRWGFPCLRACAWSGGLLPHLFTLTGASCEAPAVYSLWHFPSARLAASPPACIRQRPSCVGPARLRGIAPYGVRTFLLPRIAPGKAILRPSKITGSIACRRPPDKRACPAQILALANGDEKMRDATPAGLSLSEQLLKIHALTIKEQRNLLIGRHFRHPAFYSASNQNPVLAAP